ncbi:MAG: FKBP-type peptidyl-prolyl cis-trans isomerase [Gemmatimonadota bacterium]|nr:MAG: FKBP-type peptidyl-prolyl cis-trans isomerase [Gemmatimonadota bacterium]
MSRIAGNVAKTAAIAVLVSGLAACGSERTAELESFEEQASYAVGVDIGSTLRPSQAEIDMPSLVQGISDGLADRELLMSNEEMDQVLREFASQMQQAEAERLASLAESNKQEGEAYLSENGARSGVVTTASGLQYEVLAQGAGPKATASDRVKVHYRGTLTDGTEFGATDRSGEPASFMVDGVIAGWTEVLQLMNVGSKYRVVIPSDLAYGSGGGGPTIGPNATLVFEIELIEIVQ